MGYHIAILRTKDGLLDHISTDELSGLVETLPGSRIYPDTRNKKVLNVVISLDGKDSLKLAYQNGVLWGKNPGDVEIQLMIEIAGKLGARVRGDELETYRTVTDVYIHPDDKAEFERFQAQSRTLINRTKRRRMIWLAIKATAIVILLAGIFFSRR